jgi:hypothetical protein
MLGWKKRMGDFLLTRKIKPVIDSRSFLATKNLQGL